MTDYPTTYGNPNYPHPDHRFKVGELQLGDVVELFEGAWGTAIVQKINKDGVTLFRPYGTNHDFATLASSSEYGDTTGRQIITLTGTETCHYMLDSKATFKVYYRQSIR